MKDILIVVSPSTDAHIQICDNMRTVILEEGGQVRYPVDTAFLLNGPRSFEIAAKLFDIAIYRELPIAVFEIESVLHAPATTPTA